MNNAASVRTKFYKNYKKSLTPPQNDATLQSVDALHFKALNFKALNHPDSRQIPTEPDGEHY
jgi:hypothetical protein